MKNSIFRTFVLILGASLAACRKPEPAKSPPQEPTAQVEPAAKVPTHVKSAESDQIAALIDPAKLATLKIRGANPRILKITAILWLAKKPAAQQTKNQNPHEIVAAAIEKIGWKNTEKGRLTADAILRNLDILEKLGSTTPEDIDAMRHGKSPTVRNGSYAGDILSVDHIIPVAVAPELSNTIANLELMPLRLNQSKNDKIGERQRDLLQKFIAAELLEESKIPR